MTNVTSIHYQSVHISQQPFIQFQLFKIAIQDFRSMNEYRHDHVIHGSIFLVSVHLKAFASSLP